MISELIMESDDTSLDMDKRSKVQSSHQITESMYEYN
jgi:hypothetical protein